MVLDPFGFEIIGSAKNGLEAVEIYESLSKKPDLIIMDHRMPIMSGIEASKIILDFDKTAKIIFASADQSVREHAKTIGAISFKNKPFDNKKLIKNIFKALKKNSITSKVEQ